jgi:hypothetical protein
VIEGDEFVTELRRDAGDNISMVSLPINPGLAEVFPILSKTAQVYDLYRFRRLEFYYVPRVTEFKCGTGIAASMTDYDALDAPPEGIRNILNNDPHSEAMPHMTQRCVCDPAALADGQARYKYVRTSQIFSGDLKTYDGGVFYFATEGTPDDVGDDTLLGELHVRYVCEFKKQNLNQVQGVSEQSPRNYSYIMVTHSIENGPLPLADTGGSGFNDLIMFGFYWDWETEPQSCLTPSYNPLFPDAYPQGAFGNIVKNASDFELAPGRYLFMLEYCLNADDPDPNPGNVEVFRVELTKIPENAARVPQWNMEAIATHHDSSAGTANVFTVLGIGNSIQRCLTGGTYRLEYQLATRAQEGATFFGNMTIVRLQ